MGGRRGRETRRRARVRTRWSTAGARKADLTGRVKGKCALGPFLSILVIECQHKCLNVNQYPWMNKVQI
jgi:hypothetical protein